MFNIQFERVLQEIRNLQIRDVYFVGAPENYIGTIGMTTIKRRSMTAVLELRTVNRRNRQCFWNDILK